MDARRSPEQAALGDTVAQVVDRLGPRVVAALDDAERADKLDATVAASGWLELREAEAGGAPLASGVEAAVVQEELGRGLADVAFLGPTLAAELRRLAGAPAATSAETVALEPSLRGMAVAANGAGPDGAVAIESRRATSALVLVAGEAGEAGPVLAQVALSPIVVGADLTRPSALVDPASAIEPVALIGAPERTLTPADMAAWTALGLAMTSADLVGVMRGALDLTVEYATTRRQYGRAIGSFQAVQHLLADAHVLMEGSRSSARHAAWAVDALPPDDALAAAAAAKAYCARAARTVCETSIQVHGGIGNTWECLAHVFLRRALFSIEVLGGVGPSLERVLAHHDVGGGDGLR
jgi:alkylation response protein AidB-like acyl-CoA dehydrogenase